MHVTLAMLLLGMAFLTTCNPVSDEESVVVDDSQENVGGAAENSVGSEAAMEEEETQSTGESASYVVDQNAPGDEAEVRQMLNSEKK
ncbi:hypothetical protein CSKR_110918 [Clonorchis sinensis]|uniref:Secreted protein n=1 Tax=Clonorchis sinensis TaxID=79923 RepID=A0A8T1MLQ7_CLOSI|nr:hypothetical protein CSKR_110918 [Clonorchis sinensis]